MRINTVCNFSTLKIALVLKRLLWRLVLSYHVDIQTSSCEGDAKFKFLGMICKIKMSWRVHFLGFQKLKLKNVGGILGSLQTSLFELLACWNVCILNIHGFILISRFKDLFSCVLFFSAWLVLNFCFFISEIVFCVPRSRFDLMTCDLYSGF